MTAITEFKRRLPGLRSAMSQLRRMAKCTTANVSILAAAQLHPDGPRGHGRGRLLQRHPHQSLAASCRRRGRSRRHHGARQWLRRHRQDQDRHGHVLRQPFAATHEGVPADPEVAIDFTTRTVHMAVSVNTDQLLTNLITNAITIGVESAARADKGLPVCMLALNPTVQGALSIQGTADIYAIACATQVNSNHAEAMRQTGSSKAVAESFCVYGNYSGSNYTPTPPNATACASRIRWPRSSPQDLAVTNLRLAMQGRREQGQKWRILGAQSRDLLRGTRDRTGHGGAAVGHTYFSQSWIVHFRPGHLRMEAGGTGVTLLMAGAESRFANQAGANIDVTAPSSGLFAGIVLASHPDTVPPANKQNTIIGGGQMEFNGIVYFPTQPLKITGNGDIGALSAQFAIIADNRYRGQRDALHPHQRRCRRCRPAGAAGNGRDRPADQVNRRLAGFGTQAR
jgi:hypothetical protein